MSRSTGIALTFASIAVAFVAGILLRYVVLVMVA